MTLNVVLLPAGETSCRPWAAWRTALAQVNASPECFLTDSRISRISRRGARGATKTDSPAESTP